MISQHLAPKQLLLTVVILGLLQHSRNVEQTVDAFGLNKKLHTVKKVLKCGFTT